MDKMMVTIQEAAELCSVGYKVMAAWADEEDSFPVMRIGNKRVIEVQLLRQWLQERCKERAGMESTRVMRVLKRSRERRAK